jgi:hypothetical protein
MIEVRKRYSDLWNSLGSALRKHTHTRAGGERNKIYGSVKVSGNKGLKWEMEMEKYEYFPARCVFEVIAVFLSLLSTFLVPFSYLQTASHVLHVSYSGNIMCGTLMCLRLFSGVVSGTQVHYRFFHILYMLSLTSYSSI